MRKTSVATTAAPVGPVAEQPRRVQARRPWRAQARTGTFGARLALLLWACAVPGLAFATETPVAGARLKLGVSEKTAVPTSLSIILRDPAIRNPLPNPRLGATIRIQGSPDAGQCSARIDLDPSGWREWFTNGELRGYRYHSSRSGSEGIRNVELRPGRIVIRGGGSDLPCGLSPAALPVSVELQAADQRYCAEFGGTVKENRVGGFMARGAPAPSACTPRRMNIVLIVADDLGYNDLGIQGSKAIPTPQIDSLAAEGARFTSAYVSAATCGPSRVALLSGRYQQRFGFEFNSGPRWITHLLERGLDPSVTTITQVLRDAGYATGMVGKWHLGSQDRFHPIERGFDEFFGFLPGAHPYFPDTVADREVWETINRDKERANETEYLTDAFAREAVSYIERHRTMPFFLYVPFNAVHTPIEAPEVYRERFSDVVDEEQRTYYAMTSALDDAVGAILKSIDDQGLADETLVVFTNDNGGLLRFSDNAPLRLGKLYLFEGGVRVPMIIRWPGVTTAGQRHVDTVSLLDLFPTFLAAAQLAPPEGLELDGTDLEPFIRGDNTGPTHEHLYWRNGPNRAVLRDDWKLVQAGDHIWLFDLATDIGELTNLVDKHPEIVNELLTALDAWESELVAPSWPSRRGVTAIIDGVEYEIHI